MKLNQEFYLQDAITVAKGLIGKLLVRELENGKIIKHRITETEAYYGEDDSASHAKNGRTPRNTIMYARGGYTYIYLCYGIHYLLNIVTGQKNHPQAVLIRGVEGYHGPGKLTKEMKIDLQLNHLDLLSSDRIWIEDDGYLVKYKANKRIGISYATKADQNKKWRFTKI